MQTLGLQTASRVDTGCVFISSPGVELRVLSLYFACFVCVFVLFIDDTYCVHSAFSALHARKLLVLSLLKGGNIVCIPSALLNVKHLCWNYHETFSGLTLASLKV